MTTISADGAAHIDAVLRDFQRACQTVVVRGDSAVSETVPARERLRDEIRRLLVAGHASAPSSHVDALPERLPLHVVDASVFDQPERRAARFSGPFGSAVSALEDTCRSDSEGRAVLLTMDEYAALTPRAPAGRAPVVWVAYTADGSLIGCTTRPQPSAALLDKTMPSCAPFRVIPAYAHPEDAGDAERLDWLEREANAEPLVLHDGGNGRTRGNRGLGLASTGRTLREAIDQARDSAARARPASETPAGDGR